MTADRFGGGSLLANKECSLKILNMLDTLLPQIVGVCEGEE